MALLAAPLPYVRFGGAVAPNNQRTHVFQLLTLSLAPIVAVGSACEGTIGLGGPQGERGPSGVIQRDRLTNRFELYEVGGPVGGTARFAELDDQTTLVSIWLNRSRSGVHFADVHQETAAEGGVPLITLGAIDGIYPVLEVVVKELDDGTAVTYDDMVELDAHLVVHHRVEGSPAFGTADVGRNALTGRFISYPLDPVVGSVVTATATYFERKSGSTMLFANLDNPRPGVPASPIHIRANNVVTGGSIVFTANPFGEETNTSETHLEVLDDGTAVTFEELVLMDTHVDVRDARNSAVVLAMGNAGTNDVTGNRQSFAVGPIGDSLLSGDVTLHERTCGLAILEIDLVGTNAGVRHAVTIQDVALGSLPIDVAPVRGSSGRSITPTKPRDDDMPATYDGLVTVTGVIDIHREGPDSPVIARATIRGN